MSFFTVVIPLYNKENFIQKTLKSVLNQSFSDFEVLIIEDCSTDNSKSKVLEIQSKKIKLLQHTENKGLSASRNTGIRQAKSEYIAFLDADDVWKTDYLETIFSLITKFPEACLFATNYEEIYPNSIKVINNQELFDQDAVLISDFFDYNLGKPIYFPSSFTVKKEVFDSIGNYNEDITYAEDVDFNIRCNLKYKLAYSKKPLVNYTLHSENQITNSNFKNKIFPNFSSFEPLAKENASLKRYLDFNRYIIARKLKSDNDTIRFQKIVTEIDFKNLNYKQKLLLKLPVFLVNIISKIKNFLLTKGIKVATYD
jgi:glycosyltransferase involved in cell wall biosynthesis